MTIAVGSLQQRRTRTSLRFCVGKPERAIKVLKSPFKWCPKCQFIWGTSVDFLKDADLSRIGRQEGTKAGDPGLIMFNHSCGTTLSIKAERQTVQRL